MLFSLFLLVLDKDEFVFPDINIQKILMELFFHVLPKIFL